MKSTGFRQQFTNVGDACSLAQSIVDTVREPIVVLDEELRVIAASRSFYSKFKVAGFLGCIGFNAPFFGAGRTIRHGN
jgi:hypothetical protein